jgi:hypothetical protein
LAFIAEGIGEVKVSDFANFLSLSLQALIQGWIRVLL